MEENFGDRTFVIADLETLRAVADPLRTQMLELLAGRSRTVRQVAQRLGLTPSRLYYHVSQLEHHGLIEVAETNMVGNLQEKVYRAVAANFQVDPALLAFSATNVANSFQELVRSTLDTTRDDLLRGLQASAFRLEHGEPQTPRQALLTRKSQPLTASQAEAFMERLAALLEEFDGLGGSDAGESDPFALTIAFYPSHYYGEEE